MEVLASSSDEDGELTKGHMCYIQSNNTLTSWDSNDYPVKFYKDSFIVEHTNGVFSIYLNSMFTWRLFYSLKTLVDNEQEFDFHRMRLFIIRICSNIRVGQDYICYTLDGSNITISSSRIFNLINDSYNRLRRTIDRKYDQTDCVKQLLDSFISLLRYISHS